MASWQFSNFGSFFPPVKKLPHFLKEYFPWALPLSERLGSCAGIVAPTHHVPASRAGSTLRTLSPVPGTAGGSRVVTALTETRFPWPVVHSGQRPESAGWGDGRSKGSTQTLTKSQASHCTAVPRLEAVTLVILQGDSIQRAAFGNFGKLNSREPHWSNC